MTICGCPSPNRRRRERREWILETGVADLTFADTMVTDDGPGSSIATKPSLTEADGFHGDNSLSHDAVVDAAPHVRRRQFLGFDDVRSDPQNLISRPKAQLGAK